MTVANHPPGEASIKAMSGVRIIDLTRIVAGPFCTMLLGDLGAEVIKIETPAEGDPLRQQGEVVEGLSWYFAGYNRNKQSVALNLRSTEGKEILATMIRGADVLVENYRPGVLSKMGFTPARLEALNPRLIVCSISGFGSTGPYAQRPSFDFIAQAMSGFMSLNGRGDEEPIRAAIPISDLVAGLYGALGVSAALRAREQTGRGQTVSISLLDGMISLLSFAASNYLASGRSPVRSGNDHSLVAPYGLFATSDAPIAIAPSNESIYGRFLKALSLEHLRTDPRFANNDARMCHRAELRQEIEKITRTRNQATWIELLNESGVPCGPVLDLPQLFSDPHVCEAQMVLELDHPGHSTVRMLGFPIKLSDTPCQVTRTAPALGANTSDVLTSIGLSTSDIEHLRSKKII